MTKRKSISPKIRFEVFKRDNFKCCYCGKSAPDVVLEIDHIKPIAEGGTNDMINLVKSCRDCNRGKGKSQLSNKKVIDLERKQLEELQEKQNQLNLMIKWRKELQEVDSKTLEFYEKMIEEAGNYRYSLNENGRKKLKSWIKKFSAQELMENIEYCFNYYYNPNEDETLNSQSWNKAFEYIPRVIVSKRKQKEDPEIAKIYYLRGILKNRLNYIDENRCLFILKDLLNVRDYNEAKNICCIVNNWTQFVDCVYEICNGGSDE